MPEQFNDIKYQVIFNAAPVLFLLLRPDYPVFTIVDANDTYLKATSTERDIIKGRGIFDVFPDNPDDPQANGVDNLRSSLQKTAETKQQQSMPVQKYDVPVIRDGVPGFEEKYWNPKNTPVLDEAGNVLYILHQVEEVTALMQSENKRKADAAKAAKEIEEKSLLLKENQDRINAILDALLNFTRLDFSEKLVLSEKGDELDAIAFGLNSLVDELQIYMEQLKQFNAELEETNKELDSFSYSVSHDLRTPLRAISGYAQIVMEDYGDKLDEDGRKNVAVILKNARKMGMLIDDLLTFSRVGKQNLSKVPLNMTELAETVVRDLGNERTAVAIEPLQTIHGDNSMIRQLLINLVSNAIKYSGKKEKPEVKIGCYQDNDAVVFFVKDNGAGFDMKYYNKLFGVFQRLHGPSEFEGTGVGLALVDRIVRKHGGSVWAEAVPGEGATFYFSLPLEQTELKTT